MRTMRLKQLIVLVVLLAAGLAPASIPSARAGDDSQPPALPSPLCDRVRVPAGNEVAFHVYARGMQIYTWDGSKWLNTPLATLYADAGYRAQVGTHYAGPTWESNSGSTVKAARKESCAPDPGAIAWLLLQATTTSGPGVFSSVSFVQRVNTSGGVGPTAAGTFVGESIEVPYTAEYYFYRAED